MTNRPNRLLRVRDASDPQYDGGTREFPLVSAATQPDSLVAVVRASDVPFIDERGNRVHGHDRNACDTDWLHYYKNASGFLTVAIIRDDAVEYEIVKARIQSVRTGDGETLLCMSGERNVNWLPRLKYVPDVAGRPVGPGTFEGESSR